MIVKSTSNNHQLATTTASDVSVSVSYSSEPTNEATLWSTNVNHFIDLLDIRESSLHLYERTLRLFFEWVRDTGRSLSTLTRSDVIEYRRQLFDRGLSPLTIASYLTSLRKFYDWLSGEGLYTNITQGVKTPRRVQAFKKMHLDKDHVRMLLEHFRGEGLRNYAICNLALHTGLRTIEIIRANVEDITFLGNRRVLLVWGKGHDTRDDFAVLTDDTYKPIKDYLATRKNVKPSEPLFTSSSHRNTGERLTTQSISKIVKSGLRAIGLDGKEFTAHSLRHTSGVMVINNGGSVSDAQNLLRHTSPTTTQIYIESIKREQRLAHSPEDLIDKALQYE